MAHYHIVWLTDGSPCVDLAAFDDIKDAKICAEELVRAGERYEIKEHPDECTPDCPAWQSRLGRKSPSS